MQEDYGDVEFWPGEGPALGTRLVKGAAAFCGVCCKTWLAFSVGLMSGTSCWECGEGREHQKCDESINNWGKRERKCEVAL